MLKYRLVDQAVPAMWRTAEAGLAVRKCTDDARAPPDLARDALARVVVRIMPPVLLRSTVLASHTAELHFRLRGGQPRHSTCVSPIDDGSNFPTKEMMLSSLPERFHASVPRRNISVSC